MPEITGHWGANPETPEQRQQRRRDAVAAVLDWHAGELEEWTTASYISGYPEASRLSLLDEIIAAVEAGF